MKQIQLSIVKNKHRLKGKWFRFDVSNPYRISQIDKNLIIHDYKLHNGKVIEYDGSFMIVPGHHIWDFVTIYKDLEEVKIDLL